METIHGMVSQHAGRDPQSLAILAAGRPPLTYDRLDSQIRYVGEWHSHPRRASALPSSTDLRQVAWLRHELAGEGLPALMAIAADNGRFSFVIADSENSARPADDGSAGLAEKAGRRA